MKVGQARAVMRTELRVRFRDSTKLLQLLFQQMGKHLLQRANLREKKKREKSPGLYLKFNLNKNQFHSVGQVELDIFGAFLTIQTL